MDTTKKRKRTSRLLVALMIVTLAFTMSFAGIMNTQTVYGSSNTVLTVKYGKTSQKFYLGKNKDGDIALCYRNSNGQEQVLENAGSSQSGLMYSSVNDVGTGTLTRDAYGPTVKSILAAAGISGDLSGKSITFDSQFWNGGEWESGYLKKFDCTSLVDSKRYCYPDIPVSGNGETAVKDSANKTQVPTILALNKDGKLIFGQLSPSEHVEPGYVKGMAKDSTTDTQKVRGEIVVSDTSVGAWKNDVAAKDGLLVRPGAELKLTYNDQVDQKNGVTFHNYLYYTTNGTTPTMFSAIYNWDPKFNGPEDFAGITAPNEYGPFTVKVKVMGQGKKASATKTLKYLVCEDITKFESKAKLSKEEYIYTGRKFRPAITVQGLEEKTDYTVEYLDNVKTGIGAVKVTGTVNPYGGTFTLNFKIKPAKAEITKTTAGKGQIKVTVASQKDSGISGYQVFYKKKDATSWSKVTLAADKTIRYIKKLKKGKTYYVKARAYTKTSSGTLYGSYSKTKLTKKVK